MDDGMWNAADYIAKSLKLDPNQFAAYCIEKYIMDAVEKAEAKSADVTEAGSALSKQNIARVDGGRAK
jgi:hypothetical protein